MYEPGAQSGADFSLNNSKCRTIDDIHDIYKRSIDIFYFAGSITMYSISRISLTFYYISNFFSFFIYIKTLPAIKQRHASDMLEFWLTTESLFWFSSQRTLLENSENSSTNTEACWKNSERERERKRVSWSDRREKRVRRLNQQFSCQDIQVSAGRNAERTAEYCKINTMEKIMIKLS